MEEETSAGREMCGNVWVCLVVLMVGLGGALAVQWGEMAEMLDRLEGSGWCPQPRTLLCAA